MKKFVAFLKIAIPLGIIAWLVMAIEPRKREELWSAEKNWPLLWASFALVLAAVCITFVRWYLLVRALGLAFRLRDAFRLGFLAYLLNFVSLGSVGGDLFKAIFIAREQRGRRTEAVATVIVDRLVGLYGLLVLTTAALCLVDIPKPTTALVAVSNVTFICTGLCTLGVALALTPWFYQGRLAEYLTRLPKIGPLIAKVLLSVQIYRRRYLTMSVILAMSMSVHALLAIATYLIANALFEETPNLGEHFLIVPMSNVAGSVPFMPAGLGSFEFAMEELYRFVPKDGPGDVVGVLVALTYRFVTLAIAGVGIVYYWTCRQEVRELLKQAEQEAAAAKTKEVDNDAR